MKEYISEYGTVSETEVLSIAEKYMKSNFSVYAVHTNRFYCGNEIDIDVKRLIELRIFSEQAELRISRMNIGADFYWRYIDDDAFNTALKNVRNEFLSKLENRIYDEKHFLDIDSKKSGGFNYTTTGGGSYSLPIEDAEKIKIRNYLDYDQNGIAVISDFRIIGFLRKGSAE